MPIQYRGQTSGCQSSLCNLYRSKVSSNLRLDDDSVLPLQRYGAICQSFAGIADRELAGSQYLQSLSILSLDPI